MIIYNAEVNGELKTVVTDGGKIISVEENRQSGDSHCQTAYSYHKSTKNLFHNSICLNFRDKYM